MKTEYIVMSARAKMPGNCFGARSYYRLAVCEVVRGVVPKMISPRAKGMVRVVRTWERLFSGKTKDCAYEKALEQALDLVNELSVS